MATALIPADAIIRSNGEVKTTSLMVAEAFSKQHKDVLRKLESLDCSPKFASAHFCAHVKNQQVGIAKRDIKYYEMTKDGFIFLVMGFTGKKAAAIKEAYINAFNQMAEQLNRQPKKLSSDKTVRLRQAVDMLVSKKSIPYPACYRIVHHRFDVDHIDQLTPQQIPQAVEYIHKLAFDGEWLPPVDSPAVAAVPQFSAQDLYSFGLLLNRAEHMRLYIDSILPLLKIAEHRLYGPMREQADTARLDIARCIPLLERELHRDQDEFLVQLTQLMKRLHG
ncbi:Rha family transcriptional regulator [Shewanella sp. C32]|uniref:Rha family transcriptional regulator n=1 Tax=Shewanella electrica TaxID=515560 RepID=A0ABT2FTI0_9GAMM|nr:Rha family transcriptional regulator [Shewanella electrica]MCH1926866.1 Rha family transcriptional regulator [Shewanella electrica]MCS4558544.1 Rha family transcriptional regulator [Shewanella electrica]